MALSLWIPRPINYGHFSVAEGSKNDLFQAQCNKEMLARQWRLSRLLSAFNLQAISNVLTTV